MGNINLIGEFTLKSDTAEGCEAWTLNLINSLTSNSNPYFTHVKVSEGVTPSYLHGWYKMKFVVTALNHTFDNLRTAVGLLIQDNLPTHIPGTFRAQFSYTDPRNSLQGMSFDFDI